MRASFKIGGYVLLAVGVVALGGSLLAGGRVSRAASSSLALQPPSQVVRVGEPVKLDIAVSGVANLAAWEVTVKYDPAVLAFSSFEHTSWMDSTGRTTSCPSPSVNALLGTALVGCASLDFTPPGPDGDGVVAHITLSARAAGVSNLEIIKVQLSNPLGDDCCGSVTAKEGVVRVTSASGGDTALPPTPTPDPSKATPTVVAGIRTSGGDQLKRTPGAGTLAPSGGASTGGAAAGTGSPSATGSGPSGGVAGASGDIFTQSRAGQAGSTAPNAGTGTLTSVRSRRAQAVAVAFALAGLACVLASKAGTWRRAVAGRPRR